ncbi:hypothetical protein GCK32_003346 [Trichostrongylus colubriformis]|uniref:Phosphodeoxyriboaldolase n=1 Tax=Trichostrongylus colubriformis TaxID=6319 RepID=A0AAN8FPQ9_TRICO
MGENFASSPYPTLFDPVSFLAHQVVFDLLSVLVVSLFPTMLVSQFSILEIYESGEELSMSPHQVRKRLSLLVGVFEEISSGIVALCMKRSAELICVVVALLEKHKPFMFVQSEEQAISFGAQWFYNGSQVIKLSCNKTSTDGCAMRDLCYVIRTSGSTGEAKLVGVPYFCIEPNIEDFRKRFSVSCEDIILCSTSFSFDPSIIEMFLSFVSGARLLLVSDNTRSQPHLLSGILRKYKPTVVQLTPSILSLLDDTTLAWMLGDSSCIRCLLIGGENFPLDLVNRFRTASNSTKIFNVYGVTEVSCWATVAEVKFRCDHIGIGAPLRCTTLALKDNGELLIGGSRRCFINGVLSGEFTPTGDIAVRRGDEFFVVGRTDDQVKVNGMRCNLASLSKQAAKLSGITFAQFLLYKEKFLVLFVVSNSRVENIVRETLPSAFTPSKIVYLDKVPVNSNGKTDRPQLIAILEKVCSTHLASFTSMFSFLEKFGIKSTADLLFHSFVDYGKWFTQITVFEVKLIMGTVEALHDILSPDCTIASVMEKYSNVSWCASDEDGPRSFVKEFSLTINPQPNTKWAFCTEKCIDSTPCLVRLPEGEHIVAASHSGLVVCMRIKDGICRWQNRFPCRFEASVESCGNHVVLGGYDGCIYLLSISTGSLEWKFPTGDAVKAACAIEDSHFVYVPSYDRNLYKLDIKYKSCCWSTRLRSGSPAKAVLLSDSVIVTTIRGSVEAIDSIKGEHRWVYYAGAPIFSSVTVVLPSGYISSVDGMIAKIRLDNGIKECSVNVGEPMFASAAFFDDHVIAVTERGSLFSLDEKLRVLRCFRFTGCSFIVPPQRFAPSVFVLVSSSGILVVFSQNDNDVQSFRLGNGSIFSRVLFSDEKRYLLAGNRDDWLRCFEIPAGLLYFIVLGIVFSLKEQSEFSIFSLLLAHERREKAVCFVKLFVFSWSAELTANGESFLPGIYRHFPLVLIIFYLVQDSMRSFDQAQFDKETSRNFDSKEIASVTARYEKEAGDLVTHKEEIRKLVGYIDLTTLAGDDTKDRVVKLVDRALSPIPGDSSTTCAAVCVYPQRVHDVTKHLKEINKKFNVAAVAAGFPSGQYHLKSKMLEVELTVADGATEIDIVISRAAALDGDWKTVFDEVSALKATCGSAHLKTILATGELKTLTNVYKASWASILAGSDFIKTSTGKESTNATLEVAFVMCSAIKRWHELTAKKVGFKPAGGIKTPLEALAYVALIKDVLGEEWLTPKLFRIGASSLLDYCLKAL